MSFSVGDRVKNGYGSLGTIVEIGLEGNNHVRFDNSGTESWWDDKELTLLESGPDPITEGLAYIAKTYGDGRPIPYVRPSFAPVTQAWLMDGIENTFEAYKPDMVNEPPHYTSHPSGVECIEITKHMGFCLGNAIKYIWRADLKGSDVEDLKKARFYLDREIEKREAGAE